jgi:hypothetical protein
MRTWMRRGIPVALLAGGVLAMSAGNAAAVPAPIGDPTGLADTALRLTDIVGHKGLPPLPDTSQIQLPTMPVGQSQRDLDPAGLAGSGLSLSNVQLNGQDLPKPQLPGLPALPGLNGGQRDLDPTHIAISDVPQLQQLPKVPSVASGLPISVLPNLSTARALPNVTYSGVVPTGGVHELTQLPNLSGLPLLGGATGERDLPSLPALPLQLPALPALPGASAERDLPGLSLLGSLPGLGGQQRALPALPGLEMVHGLIASTPLAALLASTPLGSVAGRELPGLPALPLQLPALPGTSSARALPGLSLLSSLPFLGALGLPADAQTTAPDSDATPDSDARALPVPVPALPQLPGLGALPLGAPAAAGTDARSLPGLSLLGSLPFLSALGAPAAADATDADATPDADARSLPALPALPLQLPALPGVSTERDLPGLSLLGSLPGLSTLGAPAGADATDADATDADATDSDATPDTDARALPIPALPALPLLGGLPLGAPADADAADSDVTPDTRALPVVDSVLPKLPLAIPAVPGASLSGIHGVPALGQGFTTMPANDSAREIVPGLPSTSGLLGGLLGHAPMLPVTGV